MARGHQSLQAKRWTPRTQNRA